MSVVNLLILFISVKAAFTLKDHVLGFGNLRTLLWLSVVSLPLMGLMWVLAVLSASENSQLLSLGLCVVVVIHAIFCLIGYCVINKRVRENLNRTVLRCMGKKVPLLDSSMGASNSSHTAHNRSPGGFLAGSYETQRRNMGISASSTTSRSTGKTGSSPYRSDGQLRHTSTSTSNYNSTSDMQSKGYESSNKHHREGGKYKRRKDSDSGSESDGRSLDLASSHSSDDEESRAGGGKTSTLQRGNALGYLPNITEHVTASTPPELNVVQSPQLFPSVKAPLYAPRWSSQLGEAYGPPPPPPPLNNNLNGQPNVGRWSQDTCSDNEIHPMHKPSSPHPLPNPDITDHTYLHHNKMNMPPSILENIAESYNYNHHINNNQSPNPEAYDWKELPDNNNYPEFLQQTTQLGYGGGMDGKDFGSTQLVNHMRPSYHDGSGGGFLKEMLYDKQRPMVGSKTNSPYMSKEHISSELYSPQYSNGSGNNNLRSMGMYGQDPVQSLKNDYQVGLANELLLSVGLILTGFYSPRALWTGITRTGCQRRRTRTGTIFHTPRRRII